MEITESEFNFKNIEQLEKKIRLHGYRRVGSLYDVSGVYHIYAINETVREDYLIVDVCNKRLQSRIDFR